MRIRHAGDGGVAHQTPTARRQPLTRFERNAMASNVICPRCAFDAIEQLYTSPVPGVWEVLQCQQCLYCWRTSEPARRTDRDAYPASFRMTQADIDTAAEVPSIPPLRTTP